MGLTHPENLDDWQRWQDRHHRLRSLRGRLRRAAPTGLLTRGSADADLLVVIDSTSPSNVAALLAPLACLDPQRVVVLSPGDVAEQLPAHPWTTSEWSVEEDLGGIRLVLAAGHYLHLGAAAFALATARELPFVIVQHGLLTPSAPPLPPGALLASWSEQDGEFWASRRSDVTVDIVGSQLLWHAGAAVTPAVDRSAPPTYLGQLHGAELPRAGLAAAAGGFCRTTGATYRPHPSERDRRSLRQHAVWEAEGIRVDHSPSPLNRIETPVVSVFSTGVLEAAARGNPAFVDYPDPPSWLEEFWLRYGMLPWGGAPTPAPARAETSPARLVADLIEGLT